MEKSDIGSIRKRIKNSQEVFTMILTGNFVDGKLVSSRIRPYLALEEEELDIYNAIFLKILGGRLNRNAYVINCNRDVSESPMGRVLRDGMQDVGLCKDVLLQTAAESYVDKKGRFSIIAVIGEMNTAGDTFLLCAICPVEKEKPKLVYNARDKELCDGLCQFAVKAPAVAIMYPGIEEKAPVYDEALFYAKSIKTEYDDLITNMVSGNIPATSNKTKEWFSETLGKLGEPIHYEQVKFIQNELTDKAAVEQRMGKEEILSVLKHSGVSQPSRDVFAKEFDETFGKDELAAENLMPTGAMEITNGLIKIHVTEDGKSLLQIKMVDGRKSIVIPLVENNILVNGIVTNTGNILKD